MALKPETQRYVTRLFEHATFEIRLGTDPARAFTAVLEELASKIQISPEEVEEAFNRMDSAEATRRRYFDHLEMALRRLDEGAGREEVREILRRAL